MYDHKARKHPSIWTKGGHVCLGQKESTKKDNTET